MFEGQGTAAIVAQQAGVEWRIDDRPVDYPAAVAAMEDRVARIHAGTAPELIWVLEHPPCYTAGTSARQDDVLDAGGLPIFASGRGGQLTYHGPGQRIVYVMLDLKRRGRSDVRAFVCDLERWLIATLAQFNIKGERRDGRIGVWVDMAPYGGARGTEAKIAAIGVRVRHWVTFHGISVNIDPDLSRYAGIVPCGIREHGVTSMHALGHLASTSEVDSAFRSTWVDFFSELD